MRFATNFPPHSLRHRVFSNCYIYENDLSWVGWAHNADPWLHSHLSVSSVRWVTWRDVSGIFSKMRNSWAAPPKLRNYCPFSGTFWTSLTGAQTRGYLSSIENVFDLTVCSLWNSESKLPSQQDLPVVRCKSITEAETKSNWLCHQVRKSFAASPHVVFFFCFRLFCGEQIAIGKQKVYNTQQDTKKHLLDGPWCTKSQRSWKRTNSRTYFVSDSNPLKFIPSVGAILEFLCARKGAFWVQSEHSSV